MLEYEANTSVGIDIYRLKYFFISPLSVNFEINSTSKIYINLVIIFRM